MITEEDIKVKDQHDPNYESEEDEDVSKMNETEDELISFMLSVWGEIHTCTYSCLSCNIIVRCLLIILLYILQHPSSLVLYHWPWYHTVLEAKNLYSRNLWFFRHGNMTVTITAGTQ